MKAKKVFFINISNVNGRVDRNNDFIDKCEKVFRTDIEADKIISTKLLMMNLVG